MSGFSFAVSAQEQKVVKVSNVDGLLASIASDTKIILALGKYVIESADDVIYDGWTAENEKTLEVRGISNLRHTRTGGQRGTYTILSLRQVRATSVRLPVTSRPRVSFVH